LAKQGFKIPSEAQKSANIAKNAMNLDPVYLEKPVRLIIRMAELATQMLKDVISAYLESDVPKAIAVWHRDDAINRIYADLLIQLRSYMKADSDNINTYTSLIFTARCCERIGDHIKNVAEGVYFIIHGDSTIDHPMDKKQHAT
jgi:phosphate transport system protein